jgi:hypothetical protein
LRLELDGEVTRTLSGYKAEAAHRVMLVPYRLASDPASALLITKQRGLLIEKLSRMSADAALIEYLTWLPPALEEN